MKYWLLLLLINTGCRSVCCNCISHQPVVENKHYSLVENKYYGLVENEYYGLSEYTCPGFVKLKWDSRTQIVDVTFYESMTFSNGKVNQEEFVWMVDYYKKECEFFQRECDILKSFKN